MMTAMPDSALDQLPDLDYAFLAEYAKVEPHGTLTVVGASFTKVHVMQLPASPAVYVAGRLRAKEGAPPVPLGLTVSGPGPQSPTLELHTEMLVAGPDPYEGRLGLLFALGITLPVMEFGIYTFTLSINGTAARSLKVDVTAP